MWGWRGKRDRDVQTLRCVEIENKKKEEHVGVLQISEKKSEGPLECRVNRDVTCREREDGRLLCYTRDWRG